MSQEETKFSEHDAIVLIEQTIKSAKSKVSENGFIFLLWGWLVLIGYTLTYTFIVIEKPAGIGYSWIGIGAAGFIASFIYYFRKGKSNKSNTQLGKYFTYLWSGIGLGASILYTYFILAQEWTLITPFMLSMAGIGTFVSGRMLKVSGLTLGGISFLIGSGFALYFQSEWQFLIGAICMVSGYLIPGYMLRYRHKKG